MKSRAERLESEVHALYLAYRDPRTPWYARALTLLVVGYVLSPIDPIPDFIPVVGYLDEILLVPILVSVSLRMIPDEVVEEVREKADESERIGGAKRVRWLVVVLTVLIWLLVIYLGAVYLVLPRL